jgi:hypothetical protein
MRENIGPLRPGSTVGGMSISMNVLDVAEDLDIK